MVFIYFFFYTQKSLKTNLQEFHSGILVTTVYFSFVNYHCKALYLVIIVKIIIVNIPIYENLNDTLLIY